MAQSYVAGAPVNAQTAGGATSLHRAAYAGHTDVAALL
jgi:ankyrin repeat protein